MELKKTWVNRDLTAADLGTTFRYENIPDRFFIPRILITFQGSIVVAGAGGTTDYIFGSCAEAQIIRNIKFTLGSATILKNFKGYQCFIKTAFDYPSRVYLNPLAGTVAGLASTTNFIVTLIVSFKDMNDINGDLTTLAPKLYEDISMEIEMGTITDMTIAGDRPFTMTGQLLTEIVQDNNPVIKPNQLLKEWTDTQDVLSSGPFEYILPRSPLLQEFKMYETADGIPTFGIIDAALAADSFTIDVESGSFEMINLHPSALPVDDYKMTGIVNADQFGLFLIPVDLNPHKDMKNMFINTAQNLKRWSAKFNVTYAAPPPTLRIENHYTGRIKNKF